jgi:hypothetical protein
MQTSNLKYLRHSEIDYAKWDQCIDDAFNSRIYATSWYLDRTALVWDALVWNDYEFVMPLPAKQKLGIKYLYQPLYCQQLGIFPPPAADIAAQFYNYAKRLFSYSDIQINSLNPPVKNLDDIQFIPRKNFLLHMGTEYNILSSAFSKNTQRNIGRAAANRLNFVEGIRLEEYMLFKQDNSEVELSEAQLQRLKSIIAYSQFKGIGEITGVYSAENELCAAVFFCRWKERVIYMNAVSSSRGKELRAMFLLVNRFLESSATNNLLLDFEGSMLPGVARFFEGFGATPEIYFQMKFNRLPAFIKWIKNFSK